MIAKITPDIVTGVLALATAVLGLVSAWLGYKNQQKKSKLEDISSIRTEVRNILDEKVGKISQLRSTGGLTPDQRQRLDDIADDLQKIDTESSALFPRKTLLGPRGFFLTYTSTDFVAPGIC